MKTRLCALGLLACLASPAWADSCGGQLVDYKPLTSGSKTIGQLQLYYNAGNGNNCAILKHADATWGQPLYTRVVLYTCTNRQCSSYTSPTQVDENQAYRYEAGPVRIYGRGACVQASGTMGYQGGYPSTKTAVHCG